MSNANPSILVLGGSSGIGKQIGIHLTKNGYNVCFSGRSKEKLNLLKEEYPCQKFESADLSKTSEIDSLIDRIQTPLDGVVYSAGIIDLKLFHLMSLEDFQAYLTINLVAPFYLIQRLILKKKIIKGASIVLISSITGSHQGLIGGVGYGTSKAGMIGLMKSLALELGKKRIRVNLVSPAMVATESTRDYLNFLGKEAVSADLKKYPLGRFGTTDDVASVVHYLLKDESNWITGQDIVLDGGRTIN